MPLPPLPAPNLYAGCKNSISFFPDRDYEKEISLNLRRLVLRLVVNSEDPGARLGHFDTVLTDLNYPGKSKEERDSFRSEKMVDGYPAFKNDQNAEWNVADAF